MTINTIAKLITAFIFILLLGALPFSAQSAGAASDINLVILEAEGLSFQVIDTAFLDYYAFSDFPRSLVAAPQDLGKSVLITRYMPVDDVYIEPFDRLVYFLSADNSGGYIYYLGEVNRASQFGNKWYRGRPEAEKLIRDTFADHTTDLSKLVIVSLAVFIGLVFLVLRSAR